jgi:hypothetical protein
MIVVFIHVSIWYAKVKRILMMPVRMNVEVRILSLGGGNDKMFRRIEMNLQGDRTVETVHMSFMS